MQLYYQKFIRIGQRFKYINSLTYQLSCLVSILLNLLWMSVK